MKTKYFFISLLLVSMFGYAQQMQDDNSAIINAYFKQFTPNKATAIAAKSPITQIIQEGNFNHVEAQTNRKQSLTISQKGNQNFASLLSYFSTTALNLTIFQTGNNNGISIFGENELIKNAVIKQNASNQHLIITNY